jgi:hypothetical protein
MDAGDGIRDGLERGSVLWLRVGVDHPVVEGSLSAVGGDLQHVVDVGCDRTVGDRFGSFSEALDIVENDGRCGDRDGVRGALPVGSGLELRGGQVEIFGGLDVREHVPHAQHFGHVLEAREPGLQAEAAALGAISISEVVTPKVAAQASNASTPASRSRSGRRYLCMTWASVMEFAIGVAVATVTTRAPCRSRR